MTTILNWIFPPLCLHCSALTQNNKLFCKGCTGFFEMIDPMTRCPYCFSENERKRPCKNCIQKKRFEIEMASALDYTEPVITLTKEMKNGKAPHLSKIAASFMSLQFSHLGWPFPDAIVPIPKRRWYQKKDHAEMIALELSKILKVPLMRALYRHFDFPQSKKCASKLIFFLKKESALHEKNLLLVDDVIFSGTTFRQAAAALKDGLPSKLFALALARSISC